MQMMAIASVLEKPTLQLLADEPASAFLDVRVGHVRPVLDEQGRTVDEIEEAVTFRAHGSRARLLADQLERGMVVKAIGAMVTVRCLTGEGEHGSQTVFEIESIARWSDELVPLREASTGPQGAQTSATASADANQPTRKRQAEGDRDDGAQRRTRSERSATGKARPTPEPAAMPQLGADGVFVG